MTGPPTLSTFISMNTVCHSILISTVLSFTPSGDGIGTSPNQCYLRKALDTLQWLGCCNTGSLQIVQSLWLYYDIRLEPCRTYGVIRTRVGLRSTIVVCGRWSIGCYCMKWCWRTYRISSIASSFTLNDLLRAIPKVSFHKVPVVSIVILNIIISYRGCIYFYFYF